MKPFFRKDVKMLRFSSPGYFVSIIEQRNFFGTAMATSRKFLKSCTPEHGNIPEKR
jgi:hypothetical protein